MRDLFKAKEKVEKHRELEAIADKINRRINFVTEEV
jgi:hypothetical protein